MRRHMCVGPRTADMNQDGGGKRDDNGGNDESTERHGLRIERYRGLTKAGEPHGKARLVIARDVLPVVHLGCDRRRPLDAGAADHELAREPIVRIGFRQLRAGGLGDGR